MCQIYALKSLILSFKHYTLLLNIICNLGSIIMKHTVFACKLKASLIMELLTSRRLNLRTAWQDLLAPLFWIYCSCVLSCHWFIPVLCLCIPPSDWLLLCFPARCAGRWGQWRRDVSVSISISSSYHVNVTSIASSHLSGCRQLV